ncbi:Pc21g09330 [Penicillium rubens Wisconsin 54-1255]|uniref:Pc21g09330 protein n=1 Tax=Penicillium rubens (strain ATCC 28089 / DSM 1075 / NRRL 1951 / Wisconsin 54-1255) TaxID=500485 RepID=B6HN93_PENRW|nr:Pc21g09330 [Penicillium rubens Wisconsin 54-1255]
MTVALVGIGQLGHSHALAYHSKPSPEGFHTISLVTRTFRSNRKLVTSYMLRHHPSWVEFIRQTRQLGPPFMTMSPSRPSAGNGWYTHKRILRDVNIPNIHCDPSMSLK